MWSIGAHLHFALVALVVLLVTAASDQPHYFCRMMGRTMAERCCPAEPAAASSATVRAPDCCERLVTSANAVVVASHEAMPRVHAAPAIALAPWLEYPQPTFRLLSRAPRAARAPPAIGPPLFLTHCSLLI